MNAAYVQVSAAMIANALHFPPGAAIRNAAYDAAREVVVLVVEHEELPDAAAGAWVWPSYAKRNLPGDAAMRRVVEIHGDGVVFVGWNVEGVSGRAAA